MKKLIEQYSEHNKFQIDGIETFLYMVGEEAFFNKIASFYPIYKELFKKDSVYRIFKTLY